MIALAGEKREVRRLVFCPPGPLLAVAGGGRPATIWDHSAGTVHRVWEAERGIDLGAVGKSGLVHGGFGTRGLRMLDPATGADEQWPVPAGWGGRVAADPAGRWLVCHNPGGLALARGDIADREVRPRWTARRPTAEGTAAIGTDLAVGPDGRWAFAVEYHYGLSGRPSGESAVIVVDTDSGDIRATARVPAANALEVAVGPAGRAVAVRSSKAILVWAPADLWREPVKIGSETGRHFTGLAFHPSGRWLAAAGNDRTVKLYDTATWQVARTFDWDIGRLRSVAFHPDGTLAAAGSDSGKVIVWDFDS